MLLSAFQNIRHGLFIAVLPIVGLGHGAYADQAISAASYVEDEGGAARIDYSGKLRMLSQRIVATSCNFAAGIDPEKSGDHMRAADAEIKLIVDALEFGNDGLGIFGAEERIKTVRALSMVREAHAIVSEETALISDQAGSSENLVALAKNSATLLDLAKQLVSIVSAEYSSSVAMVQADAMLVDISGRQRMLSQRMSKNICLVASGIEVEEAMAELAATAEVFATSLLALRGGMPQAGINPPPNSQIADGLSVVFEDWASLKPHVDAVLAGGTLSNDDRATVYHGMNQMTADMNTVVGYYTESSKREGL